MSDEGQFEAWWQARHERWVQRRKDLLTAGMDERWIAIDWLRKAIDAWDAMGTTGPIGPGTTEELKHGEELKHAEQRFFREIGECVRYWQGVEQVEDTDAT